MLSLLQSQLLARKVNRNLMNLQMKLKTIMTIPKSLIQVTLSKSLDAFSKEMELSRIFNKQLLLMKMQSQI